MTLPTEIEENSETTDGEFDTDSALAEMSSDLFGQGDEGDGEEQPEVPQEEVPGAEPVEPPPVEGEETPPVVEENSEEVQAVGAPKTWTNEAIADWAKIPDRAKQEILKREEDMFRGLEQYREKAELGGQYDKVVEPYRAALAAEGIDPVQMFQSFAGNHYLLARGTNEQKISIAANLMQHYGIDIGQVADQLGRQDMPVDPTVKALQERVDTLTSAQQTREQQEIARQTEENRKAVEEFASDPANQYFVEVAADVANLLKTGAAQSLKDAYEKAVWLNPTTRQKELDRSTAEKEELRKAADADRVKAAKAAQSANVNTSQKTRDGTVPVGTMDDTLNDTLAKIQSRG